MKERLLMFLRRFIPSERNVGANRERDNKRDSQLKFKWAYVKTKLQILTCRFVLFARNIGANRGRRDKADPELKFKWPYVMSSSIPILGPAAQGSWVWHRHHKHSHHGFYRSRR